MAGEIASASFAATVDSTDSLYRGINPLFFDFEEGELKSGVFLLKKNHKLEDGPSVGIARLVSLQNFQPLIGVGWGVGELSAGVPQSLQLTVHPLPDEEWGINADAHAVITDYQRLSNRLLVDAQRALRDALQKNILVKPLEQPAK
jgi:hypothetical protein